MARWFPALALFGVWLTGGLASALAIAQANGDLRYLALGVVTAPFVVLTALAVRRTR